MWLAFLGGGAQVGAPLAAVQRVTLGKRSLGLAAGCRQSTPMHMPRLCTGAATFVAAASTAMSL